MMNSIIIGFRYLFTHYKKIALCLTLILVFLFLLFPLSDLNDFISNQIYKESGNQAYVQFEKLSVNPLTMTLSLEQFSVETPQLSNIEINEISLKPSLAAALQLKPGGEISATGLFKGDLNLSFTPSFAGSSKKTTSQDSEKSDHFTLQATGTNLSLKELKKTLNLNLPISGQLKFNTQLGLDLNMTKNPEGNLKISIAEQPEGELSLSIQNFDLPSSTILLPSPDGGPGLPFNLPKMNLSLIDLKAKLSNGKLIIESGKIGNNKDDLNGEIKGELGLTFQVFGGKIVPQFGAYTISVELKASPQFKERAQFFFQILNDNLKKETPEGTLISLRLQGDNFAVSPRMTPLQ